MFYTNIIKSYRDVVAICDAELLGKKFEQGNIQLDIKENFYNSKEGQKKSEKEVIKLIQKMSVEDATFNIVGEKAITLAIGLGLIEKDSVKKILGVPYALVLI